MLVKLKPCPFCGGKLRIDDRKLSIESVVTRSHCTGCHTEFAYCQDFVFSKKSRVPINESFEEMWNRRTDYGK